MSDHTAPASLPGVIRRNFERAIVSAERPAGISTHDGMATVNAGQLRYLLSTLEALQRERDEALAALAAAQERGGACQCAADEVCALRRERDAAIRARGADRPDAQSGAPQPPDPDTENRA